MKGYFKKITDGNLLLPPHLRRRLVLAEPEEARMPEQPRGRPLGEADLGHQPRRHPLNLSRWRGTRCEW